MSMPPGGLGGPGEPDTWMTVSDVFNIRGRGIVVTGQLRGSVPLNVGDHLVCEDASWPVAGIEQFRAMLTTAEPGANIGVLLKNGPPGDLLQDRTVTFQPGAAPKKRRWHR